MTLEEAQVLHTKLLASYQECNEAYYGSGLTKISDEEYDALVENILLLENQFPALKTELSPSKKVGSASLAGFPLVKHATPMLSLDNLYTEGEMAAWLAKIQNVLTIETLFTADLKIDGLAISLLYKDGNLNHAVTRGDGAIGEDILVNVQSIDSLPKAIPIKTPVEIRGELYFPRSAFAEYNLERESQGLEAYKNPRNAVAGTARMKDPLAMRKRKIDIIIYDFLTGAPQNSHHANLDQLKTWGFHLSPMSITASSITDLAGFHNQVSTNRQALPFDIDGIVIKVDHLPARAILSAGNKSPRWAVAWKFKAERARTRLVGIEHSISRFGSFTPVAVLEPITLMGSVIKRASLYNYAWLNQLDLCERDYVWIEKGGEVIPKIVGIDYLSRKDTHKVALPSICPYCKTSLVWNETKIGLLCPNPGCPEVKLLKIIHFTARDAMDIDSLGEQTVRSFAEWGWLKDVADIYRLERHREELLHKAGWKEKSVDRLFLSIGASKKRSLHQLIAALSITGLGKVAAQTIAERVKNLENFMTLSQEKIQSFPNFSAITANHVVAWLAEDENKKLLQDLVELGLEFAFVPKPSTKGQVVLTGKLSRPRAEFEKIFLEQGYSLSETVTKKTHYLIVGEDPGSKLAKAQKLGIPILTETEAETQLFSSPNL